MSGRDVGCGLTSGLHTALLLSHLSVSAESLYFKPGVEGAGLRCLQLPSRSDGGGGWGDEGSTGGVCSQRSPPPPITPW